MIALICCLVWLSTGAVALVKRGLQLPELRDDASHEISYFASQLNLPSAKAKFLVATLENSSDLVAYLENKTYSRTGLTSLACFIAETVLGNSSVEHPVPASEVDSNWSTACWETPSCAILPNSTGDVSASLVIIDFLKLNFSVRSGGHSPNPGFSSIGQPGVLIDLQKLNQTTLNTNHSIASLGPGGRWGDVYAALDPYNLSVIGGRIPHVGVGGLLLGGGYFHFSAKYGLAADNVQNFEVVLANGSVVNANAQNNNDLFWALKGGGPNFGIVTRFDVYSVPVRNIWYSVSIYPNSEIASIFNAMAEWQTSGAVTDTSGTVALVVGLTTTEIGLLYDRLVLKPASFAPFYKLTNGTTAIPPTNGTVSGVTTILGASQSQLVERHDYRAASSKIDPQLYLDVYKVWQPAAASAYASTGANQTFVIQPVPSTLVAAGNARGGNALSLPVENFQCWTTLIDWPNDVALDERARAPSIQTTQAWTQLGQQRGESLPFLFMNDAARD